MSMMKHYLLDLLTAAAPENGFAQDAIEHAIVCGNIELTYDLATDVVRVMSEYDIIMDSYRKALPTRDLLLQMYEQTGFIPDLDNAA